MPSKPDHELLAELLEGALSARQAVPRESDKQRARQGFLSVNAVLKL